LYAKFSKYEFRLRFTAFLGHIVSGDGIQVDPKKTEVVKNSPRPLYASDIPSFLGLIDYYRWFVEGFYSVASPLIVKVSNLKKMAQYHLLKLSHSLDNMCQGLLNGMVNKVGQVLISLGTSHIS